MVTEVFPPMEKKNRGNGFLERLFNFPKNRLGCLAVYGDPIDASLDIEDARGYFEIDKDLLVLPVEISGGVAGLLTRDMCMGKTLARRFSLRRRTVGDVCLTRVPIFDALQSVNSAVKRVLDEGCQGDFMIYHSGKFLGTSSVRTLLAHSARLQAMDLEHAGRVQKHFMSVERDESDPLSLEWFNRMAGDVGGDFIQYRSLTNRRRMLGVFDMSGKGIAAAMSTSLISSCLETLELANAFSRTAPAGVVGMLDRLMSRSLLEGGFLAGVFLFFDAYGKHAEIFNCGLGPVYVFPGAGSSLARPVRLNPKYPPLGMPDSRVEYVPARLKLAPGTKIFVSTDGLTDMKNPEGREFGSEALEAFLLSRKDRELPALRSELEELIRGFIHSAPQADDITFALAEWRG